MVCAFDCKELAGFTTTELSEYLADTERTCARTLCFDPEQFAPDKTAPNRTTLDRTWRDRFPDRLKSFIIQSAQRILAVAHDMSNPLGMRALEATDKTDCLNRTERRYVTEKIKDVTDALCQIVFPAIDFDRNCPDEGTQYSDTAFLDLQSYLGLTGTAANQYYSRDRHADVAIDITHVAYSGNRDEFQMSPGAPPSKSYSWCDNVIMISVVGEEMKFTLGVRPLRGYTPRSVLVEQPINIASDHVSLGTVSADAGFDGISVINALKEKGLSSLIRKSSDDRVDRFVADMDHDVAVKQSHEMEKTSGGESGHPDPGRGSLNLEER